VRYSVNSEYVLDKYIIGSRRLKQMSYERYKILIALADILAKDEIESIRNGTCPWCGRRFKGKGIAMHLKSRAVRMIKIRPYGSDWHYVYDIYPSIPCRYHYAKLIEYISDCYIKLRVLLKHKKYPKFELDIDGKRYRFKNAGELVDFIRSNPDLITKLVNGG